MSRVTRFHIGRAIRRAAASAPAIAPILTAVLAAAALAAGCSGGFFRPLMEGEEGSAWGGELAISPATATLLSDASLNIEVTGGDGNYSFSVVGGGTFDEAAMRYIAPSTVGTDRLVVSDGAGATAEAVLTIKAALRPDYRVALSPPAVYPADGTGGGDIAGSFSIENVADEPGSANIAWTVYVSRDDALDDIDLVADSGALAALGASTTSASIAYAGAWPAAGADYYLFIALSAADDGDASNDVAWSPPIAVAGTPRPDYGVVSLGAPTSAGCSKSFTESLVLGNAVAGAGDGTEQLHWVVYLSADDGIDEGDVKLGAGSLAGLAWGATATVQFSGQYPAVAGSYYFIAELSAFDDITISNNVSVSAPIGVSGPDYVVAALGAPSTQVAGRLFDDTLTIGNNGPGDGDFPIAWSVYASLDNAVLDAGDSLIASGSASALAAGASISPAYSGTWPSAAGTYYLIARAQAADDATVGELASGAITVSELHYTVTDVATPASLAAGRSFTGSFTIANGSALDRSASVSWSVYASPGDAIFDSGDSFIASGTTSGLAAGASVSPTYGGTWPSATGMYYLIARVEAADASAADEGKSGAITVSRPNYAATAVASPAFLTAGQAFSGSFTITNGGAVGGLADVSWSVYASLGNAVIDVGDSLIASGTTSALTAGASASPTYSGTWPSAAGTYYLVARIGAADDPATANDTAASAALTVSRPDYALPAIVPPSVLTAGQAYTGATFTIRNDGQGVGVAEVTWSVFLSTNGTFDAGDSLIASGTVSGLAPGASTTPTYGGTWPPTAGAYYLFFFIEADDDANAANDTAVASMEILP